MSHRLNAEGRSVSPIFEWLAGRVTALFTLVVTCIVTLQYATHLENRDPGLAVIQPLEFVNCTSTF